MIELKGITWDHSRALPPLVATAQRYEELHPGIRIRWEKRSLHEFGHMPIDQLADRFDLIVIDHPWSAFCFHQELVHDLKPLLFGPAWKDLKENCIGSSFESYHYEGHLLAIPIDAATPAPSYRPDLMEKEGRALPRTWSELIALADAGLAVMPGFNADLFLNWSMLLSALKAAPFATRERIADDAPALQAIEMLLRLAEGMPKGIFDWNPIAVAERMSRTDEIAYCAFAYSYSNYSRQGFAEKPLRYTNLVTLDDGTALRSIVGGTGIALSRKCAALATALDYALFTASAKVQAGLYAYSGGQPVRREAWEDVVLDAFSGNFFSGSRQPHEGALLRPRYNGYVPLQETCGDILQACLKREISPLEALQQINVHYRESLPEGSMPAL